MRLRPLVISSGMLATLALAPAMLALALTGHADVARGLLLGVAVGLLNSFLLARKLDRMIEGREAWQSLTRTLQRNMLLRFALIFAIGAASAQVPGIHLVGMAAGIGAYLVISLIYFSWAVLRYWKEEDAASYG
jgi:predicted membrane chloride channel (bestrophin family)